MGHHRSIQRSQELALPSTRETPPRFKSGTSFKWRMGETSITMQNKFYTSSILACSTKLLIIHKETSIIIALLCQWWYCCCSAHGREWLVHQANTAPNWKKWQSSTPSENLTLYVRMHGHGSSYCVVSFLAVLIYFVTIWRAGCCVTCVTVQSLWIASSK